MIQLHRDYLYLETAPGQIIPCSAELVAVELIGDASGSLDPELVRQAAAAVLHYFRIDLGWTTVSVGEFSRALEQALRALGSGLQSDPAPKQDGPRVCDLGRLVGIAGKVFELSFFPKLRETLRCRLAEAPKVLEFQGLRGCVKQLAGAKRWNRRCQHLNDQIVAYLRACLENETAAPSCDLIVR